MPKSPNEKKLIPVEELKTTTFTEVIELERVVTPDENLRVDHVFVRRLKINKSNPAEVFATEETSRFDIAWPEEEKKDIKDQANEEEMLKAIRSD